MDISKQAKLQLSSTWFAALDQEMRQDYWKTLQLFLVDQESQGRVIYPPVGQLFSAFSLTDLDKVKVVILGQDPYHGYGQANGLAFSINPGNKIPPSLRNIFMELHLDLGIAVPSHGCLRKWSNEGVFLLNSALTVEESKPSAHAGQGWETFTNATIKTISDSRQQVVFMLWGSIARSKRTLVDESKHLVLEAPHPSPLSCYRGFHGCQHFSKANQYFKHNGLKPIDWALDSAEDNSEQMMLTF